MPETFDPGIFKIQIKEEFGELFEELSRIKGWSFGSARNALIQILVTAPDMIGLWAMASPEQRKTAVVDSVNEAIDIPRIPESIEGLAFGYLYNLIAGRLGFTL